MDKPPIIEQQEQALYDLMMADEKPFVSVEKAAHFIGVHPSTLRRWLYSGNCTFGMGMEGDKHSNGYGVIPKLTFFNWCTNKR
jgi:hypothetical protein